MSITALAAGRSKPRGTQTRPQGASLLVAERLPRPLDGGGERPLAVVVTVACLQELEALMQALAMRTGPNTPIRDGQLDGERDAVKRLNDGEARSRWPCRGGSRVLGGARREEFESVRLTKGARRCVLLCSIATTRREVTSTQSAGARLPSRHNGCDRYASVGAVEQEQVSPRPLSACPRRSMSSHLSTVRSGALGGGDGLKQLSLLSAFGEVDRPAPLQLCQPLQRGLRPRALAHPGRTAQWDAACALFEAPLHLVHCGPMPDGCVLKELRLKSTGCSSERIKAAPFKSLRAHLNYVNDAELAGERQVTQLPVRPRRIGHDRQVSRSVTICPPCAAEASATQRFTVAPW